MKTLYLVRHAKAGEHSQNHDFERELVARGKHDAELVAGMLAEKNVNIDLIVTSPAARTVATAKAMAQGIGYPENNIASDRKIYNAEDTALVKVIQHIGDHVQSLMLVGHNPGISETAIGLFNVMITSMPTAGVVAGSFDVQSWKDVKWGAGVFIFSLTPP